MTGGVYPSAVQKRGKQQVTNGQRPLMMVVTEVVLAKRIKAGGQYVWRNRKWEGQRLIAGWHCGAERSGVAGMGRAGAAPAKEADRHAGGRAGTEPRRPAKDAARRMAGHTH
jgi:hypothetical protein